MIVRPLVAGDGAIFAQLRLSALRHEPESFAAHISDYDSFASEDWERVLGTRLAFAAFDAEAPIGLASLMPLKLSRMAHRGEIVNVFVEPAARGRGVGRALMDAIVAKGRELDLVQLELAVNADNATAIGFYDSYGFRRFGRLPRGFRHDGVFHDEVLMLLALDSTA